MKIIFDIDDRIITAAAANQPTGTNALGEAMVSGLIQIYTKGEALQRSLQSVGADVFATNPFDGCTLKLAVEEKNKEEAPNAAD